MSDSQTEVLGAAVAAILKELPKRDDLLELGIVATFVVDAAGASFLPVIKLSAKWQEETPG